MTRIVPAIGADFCFVKEGDTIIAQGGRELCEAVVDGTVPQYLEYLQGGRVEALQDPAADREARTLLAPREAPVPSQPAPAPTHQLALF